MLDGATGTGKASPSSGDFSICVYCRSWLIFTDDLLLRLAEQTDIERLDKDFLDLIRAMTKTLNEQFPPNFSS
jgi:hypothetical protein